jgi:hypothetical protein
MSFPVSGIVKCGIYSTSKSIDGFSNSDYGFLDVSVKFRISQPNRELAPRMDSGGAGPGDESIPGFAAKAGAAISLVFRSREKELGL